MIDADLSEDQSVVTRNTRSEASDHDDDRLCVQTLNCTYLVLFKGNNNLHRIIPPILSLQFWVNQGAPLYMYDLPQDIHDKLMRSFQNRHVYPLKIMYSFHAQIELPHTPHPCPNPPPPHDKLVHIIFLFFPNPSDLFP